MARGVRLNGEVHAPAARATADATGPRLSTRASSWLVRDAHAWLSVAALLAAGAIAVWWLPAGSFDWQPRRAFSQPWRWWSAVWVHFSTRHLLANLLGTAVVAALGRIARLPARSALAWAIAWPLTQLGLLWRPALLHYGGLSGVLHAGVAIAAWHLLRHTRGAERLIGALLAVGLVAKLWLETPWGPVLRHPADWDIAIAPLAHATGAIAGCLCAFALDRSGGRR